MMLEREKIIKLFRTQKLLARLTVKIVSTKKFAIRQINIKMLLTNCQWKAVTDSTALRLAILLGVDCVCVWGVAK